MDHAKRKNENHQAEHANGEGSSKRYKEAIDSAADEFVCPITQELLVDPVMADDDQLYERIAIEEHIEKSGSDLKSPFTREPMGERLRPALQVQNVIEKLVGSGAIDVDKAARWNEELGNRKVVKTLRQKVESGDTDAMCRLALCYLEGTGVKQDNSMSYSWYKKAADLGNARGFAMAGWLLIIGRGVDKNTMLGMFFLKEAEEAGSNVAAYFLGKWFCSGSHDLPRDTARGKIFLRKVVHGTCRVQHLTEINREEASKLLRELDDVAVISPESSS